MIRAAYEPNQVSIDYAVKKCDRPREHILYANQLCPGLIDEKKELVNLDRLGLTTIISEDEMPSLGFKISPKFSKNINMHLEDSHIERIVDNDKRYMAAELDNFWRRCLRLTYHGFGTAHVISGKDLILYGLDHSPDGDIEGEYNRTKIRTEIKSNIRVLRNIIIQFALYFCPLEERKENAQDIIQCVEKSMNKSGKLYDKVWYFTQGVPNHHDHEDVVQNYYLKLVDGKAKTFEFKVDASDISEDDRFTTWSFSLARNLVKDFFREEERIKFYLHRLIEREDYRLRVGGRWKTPKDSFAQIVNKEEIKSIVTRNLLRMDPYQAILISMHYFSELKYREMAEILDIPIGTAQSRLHHALERFKRLPEIAKLGKRD